MNEKFNPAEICKDAVECYGVGPQLNVAVEEMSELTKEICKFNRNKGVPDHIAEEMADVEIMLEQMRIIFNNSDGVDEWKRQKLERLRLRLGEKAADNE